MIYSSLNLHRRIQNRSLLIGKSLIVILQLKISNLVEKMLHRTQMMLHPSIKTLVLIKFNSWVILFSSRSKQTNQSTTSYGGGNNSDAQKRFSNAKAISSDQFFNKDSDVRM